MCCVVCVVCVCVCVWWPSEAGFCLVFAFGRCIFEIADLVVWFDCCFSLGSFCPAASRVG